MQYKEAINRSSYDHAPVGNQKKTSCKENNLIVGGLNRFERICPSKLDDEPPFFGKTATKTFETTPPCLPKNHEATPVFQRKNEPFEWFKRLEVLRVWHVRSVWEGIAML